MVTARDYLLQRRADGFIALSYQMKEKLTALGLDAKRIHVRYNPVIIDKEISSARISSDHRTRIVFVGRATAEKGFGALLSAWGNTVRPPSAELWAIGPGTDNVLFRSDVGNFRGLGELSHSETVSNISQASAVVVPSLWDEPFGRTVLEAAAVGVPVLATRAGALPELVVDQETGWVVEASSVGIANGLSRVLCTSAVDRNRLGRAAFERYMKTFSADAAAIRLDEIYESVLSRQPGPE
jgi:glycosyltransferase involved in cell wall biosynthesis